MAIGLLGLFLGTLPGGLPRFQDILEAQAADAVRYVEVGQGLLTAAPFWPRSVSEATAFDQQTAAAPLAYGMVMGAYPTRITALPGTTVTYTVMLTNTGTVSDTFDINISDNTWSAGGAPLTIWPLDAGSNSHFDQPGYGGTLSSSPSSIKLSKCSQLLNKI